MVDESHAVLFGGNQSGVKTNDVYMLDLSRMVSRAGNTQFINYQAPLCTFIIYLGMTVLADG